MEKNSLFYMANLYPEIGRMFSFYDKGLVEASDNAQNRALGIIDQILVFRDIAPAGREEWSVLKNFIIGYKVLGPYEREILEKYSKPFANKFMNQYSG